MHGIFHTYVGLNFSDWHLSDVPLNSVNESLALWRMLKIFQTKNWFATLTFAEPDLSPWNTTLLFTHSMTL